jgi:site-specific DNA-adenine methylase
MRKFSSNNYKGKWTRDEEIRLIEYCKAMGNSWTKISKDLNRTPEN